MDYKDYIQKKSDGRIELITAGGGYAIARKRWNPENGEAIDPEITSIDVDALHQKKADLEEEIEEIETMLSDIESL